MVWCQPNTSSSTGTNPARCGRSLVSSATMTNRDAAAATIRSRTSAPPSPLSRRRSGSTVSAPSTARSTPRASSSSSGMRWRAASAALASDVATAVTCSPSATRAPTASMNQRAVVPRAEAEGHAVLDEQRRRLAGGALGGLEVHRAAG